MKLFARGGREASPGRGRSEAPPPRLQVVEECYCPNGHSLITDLATFGGFQGITVRLRSPRQQGLLALSPIIGDKDRRFFDFERVDGEIIDICCPTCSEPLPIYNQCSCGAFLVALFSTPRADFADCIGICQRIGCLHSEIKTNRDLRLNSRQNTF